MYIYAHCYLRGSSKSPIGTSSLEARYRAFGSKKITGSGDLIADNSSPLACMCVHDISTFVNILKRAISGSGDLIAEYRSPFVGVFVRGLYV